MVCARLRLGCLEHVLLAPRTTWKIGGPARWLIQPTDVQALQQLLLALPEEIPRLVLGGGSNLLVDDDGFQGVVLDLKGRMNHIVCAPFPDREGRWVPPPARTLKVTQPLQEEVVRGHAVLLQAGAGATTRALAHFARHHGLTGAEFLGGIPGSVGGALRMNAGAYGREIRDILVDVVLLDGEGRQQTIPVERLGMCYRSTQVPDHWIFLSARFRLSRGDPVTIRAQMRRLNRVRRERQPLQFPSAGSTFKNPLTGPKAWQWIEEAGMRGVSQGGAQVSEQHSNFLINRGGARSRDMHILMDRVRERVLQAGGAWLALEVGIVTPQGLRKTDVHENLVQDRQVDCG